MELKFDLQEGFQNYSFCAVELDNNTETHNISFFTGGFKTAYSLTGKRVRLALVDKHKRGNIVELQTQGDKAIFKITDVITARDGEFFCQFNFSSSGFNQTSRYFKFVVKNNLLEEIATPIISSDLYKELREALDKVIEMENSLSVNLPKLEASLELAQGYEGFVGQVKTNTDNITKLKDEMLENINAMYIPYEGEYIAAKNSYAGGVKDLVIKGKTLVNVIKQGEVSNENTYSYTKVDAPLMQLNKTYSLILLDYGNANTVSFGTAGESEVYIRKTDIRKPVIFTTNKIIQGDLFVFMHPKVNEVLLNIEKTKILLLEGDYTNKPIPEYFEGIKSVGEDGSKIVILSTGANIFDLQGWAKANNVSLTNVDKLIINERLTLIDELYKEDKKQISLPSSIGSLKGVGNVSDEARVSEGKVVQKFEKYIVTGEESWEVNSNPAQNKCMTFHSNVLNGKALPNRAKYTNNKFISRDTWNQDTECVGVEGDSYHLRINIDKSKLSSLDAAGFKNLLKKWNADGVPLEVIYELATPIAYTIDKQTLSTYRGTTHISSETNIKPVISCKIPSDAPALISDLQKENVEYKGKLDRIEKTQYNLINMLHASNLIDKEGWAVDRGNE